MSSENYNKEVNYEMIYKQNNDIENISYAKYIENNIFEMKYNQSENKKVKQIRLESFKARGIHLYFKNEYEKNILRIFGKLFVNNNKNKCKIIYKNKKYRLKEYFEEIVENYSFYFDFSFIKLKLIFSSDYIDMSNMFFGCYHLSTLTKYEQDFIFLYDIINEYDSDFFLKYESNINNYLRKKGFYNFNYYQKKKIITVINMSYMFAECISLKSLPDISNWDISRVNDMRYMFYGCKSLASLPDISKWNISNFIDMNYMFCGCDLSLKLPEIYILNLFNNNIVFGLIYKNDENHINKIRILGNKFIKNNKDKGKIIYNNKEFELKEFFEDIDNNYNALIELMLCLDKTIEDLSYIFSGCRSLISVYIKDKAQICYFDNQSSEMKDKIGSGLNISRIQNSFTNNNSDLNYSSILLNDSIIKDLQISNISFKNDIKWFLENEKTIIFDKLIDMRYMFYKCESLISLPDISKWNTFFVTNMEYIFYD